MARYANDVFTTAAEARSRSYDLGLGGNIHTIDHSSGQAVYRPGRTPEDYHSNYADAEKAPATMPQDRMKFAITPQQQHRKDVYKAADLSVEWQEAWKGFQSSPSYSLAKSVISKGEALLGEQERLSMQFQRRDYIRHRVLVAEDYLSKTAAKNDPDRHERMNQSAATQKLQKFLDGL